MQGVKGTANYIVFEQGEKYFPCFKPRRGACPDLQPNAVQQQRSKARQVRRKKEKEKNRVRGVRVRGALSCGHGRSLGLFGETVAKAASLHAIPQTKRSYIGILYNHDIP